MYLKPPVRTSPDNIFHFPCPDFGVWHCQTFFIQSYEWQKLLYCDVVREVTWYSISAIPNFLFCEIPCSNILSLSVEEGVGGDCFSYQLRWFCALGRRLSLNICHNYSAILWLIIPLSLWYILRTRSSSLWRWQIYRFLCVLYLSLTDLFLLKGQENIVFCYLLKQYCCIFYI